VSTFWHNLASSYRSRFHITISCIFLQSIYQPTKTLDATHFITSLKLLHVPVPFSGSMREQSSHVQQSIQVLHRPRWYHYNIQILKHTESTSTNLQCCDTKTMWQWQSTVALDLYAVCIQTAVSFLRDTVNMLAISILHKEGYMNIIYRKWVCDSVIKLTVHIRVHSTWSVWCVWCQVVFCTKCHTYIEPKKYSTSHAAYRS